MLTFAFPQCFISYKFKANQATLKSRHLPSNEVGITDSFKLTELKYFNFTIMSIININDIMYSAENISVKTGLNRKMLTDQDQTEE